MSTTPSSLSNYFILKTKGSFKGQRYISSIVLHEAFKLITEKEGRETARLRYGILEKEFNVVDVDSKLAVAAAELRHVYRVPMADSIIAARALGMDCVTDDTHLSRK